MTDSEAILKKVGRVVVIVGLLDISFMVYCFVNKISYSSSFNIFAVIAGIYLIKGSLRAAAVVRFFAAFMLACFAGMMLLLPFIEPFGLLLTRIKLAPANAALSFALVALVVAFVYWVYSQLSKEEIQTARQAAGLKPMRSKIGSGLGIVLVIVLGIALYFVQNGSDGDRAVELARKQYGDSYKYHVQQMTWSGNHVWAQVVAYSDNEIRTVKVEWTN